MLVLLEDLAFVKSPRRQVLSLRVDLAQVGDLILGCQIAKLRGLGGRGTAIGLYDLYAPPYKLSLI